MELFEHRCTHCGGELNSGGDGAWLCPYCGSSFDDDTAEKNAATMREMFDENRREIVNNLRRNLYDAVNAEYLSSIDVHDICTELKKYLPDDFRAEFYLVASGVNSNKIAHYIREINVEENYEHIGDAISFLVRNLQSEFLLELNDLVERAYKYRDLASYEKYSTLVSAEADKIQSGIYETKLPREVFVAYSGKDMAKVMDLVEELEYQGLRCFVAARNLRHGRGAVENYDRALKEAMDHCRSFVFVSSMNSRALSCDALEIEIPYVRSRDIDNAPLQFRNNYVSIPQRYKKPRVEYRIEESKRYNAADEISNEFFDGYERVYSPSEVATRIIKQLISAPESDQEANQEPEPKFCAGCGQKNLHDSRFCTACGNDEFVGSISEFIKRKNEESAKNDRSTDEGEQRIVKCKICGGSNLIGSKGGSCEYCNEPLFWETENGSQHRYCVDCGAENSVYASACSSCGCCEMASSVAELLKMRERRQKTSSSSGSKIAEDLNDLVHDAEKGINKFMKKAESKINEVNGKLRDNFADRTNSERPRSSEKYRYSASNPYSNEGEKGSRASSTRTDDAKSRAKDARQNAQISEKNGAVALILCIFLGFFGIHYFYVGKVGKGILFLLTGGLCYIGWIVSIVNIVTGKFTDGQGRAVLLKQ